MCFKYVSVVSTFAKPWLRLKALFYMLLWMDPYAANKILFVICEGGRDEAMTVLGAVGLHITDLIFQAIH